MAKSEVTKPFVDYDEKNDSLFVRFAEESEATTIQFQEWLMVRVGTRTGAILAIEVAGFKGLLDRLARYVKRRHRKVAKAAEALEPGGFSLSYDKSSDSLWLRGADSNVRGVEPEPLDDGMTGYRRRATGRIVAVRIPQYSHRWYPMLKKAIEDFVDEVFATGAKSRSAARGDGAGRRRREAIADLVLQVDVARLRELATAG